MPSVHAGVRKNLIKIYDDLSNFRSFTAVVYLPVRGSDPAGMVLAELINASYTKVLELCGFYPSQSLS
jgi:hypothetical protein